MSSARRGIRCHITTRLSYLGDSKRLQTLTQRMLKRHTPLRPKKPMARGRKPKRVPKGATTIDRLLGDGKVFRASTFKPKPMKKMSDSNKGWWDVALEIWEERPRRCEVCGTGIATPHPINFSHLLPRGSYRRYKRDKRNIIIKCARHHEEWHDQGPKTLAETGGPEWFGVCVKYFQLRDEANGL